jgi:hypothetical protein
MRKLLAGLGLCAAIGAAAPLLADSPDPSVYERDSVMSTNQAKTAAQQRIFERASFEAHERMARIESRHRNGISIARPAIYTGATTVPETFWFGQWRTVHAYPWHCP